MKLGNFPYPENALILAPLSGYTDLAYRHAARRCGCRFAFTEMVDVASLTYARKRSEGMLRRGEDEDFLGVQLVCADHEFIRRAVDVVNEYSFDLVAFAFSVERQDQDRLGERAGADAGTGARIGGTGGAGDHSAWAGEGGVLFRRGAF